VRCAIAAQSRFRERDRFLGTGSGVAVKPLYANPVMTRGTFHLFGNTPASWCRESFPMYGSSLGPMVRVTKAPHSGIRSGQSKLSGTDSGVVIVIDSVRECGNHGKRHDVVFSWIVCGPGGGRNFEPAKIRPAFA